MHIIRSNLWNNHCGLKGRRVWSDDDEKVRGWSEKTMGQTDGKEHHGIMSSTWLAKSRAILVQNWLQDLKISLYHRTQSRE